MAWTYEATRRGYRNLWLRAEVKPGNDATLAQAFVTKVTSGELEQQYKAAQQRTGVPWIWFASVHYREGSNNLQRVLHNGEAIVGTGRKTTLVPAGLGPFATWADSADASVKLKQIDHVVEWTIERMLYEAERFNGLGYVGKNNSAYVWAGTTQEQDGMYVADHVYDANAEDKRLGVAACLKALQATGRPDVLQFLVLDDNVDQPPGQGQVVVHQPPPADAIPPSVDAGGMGFGEVISMVFSVLSLVQKKRQDAGKPFDIKSILNDIMALATAAAPILDGIGKKEPFHTPADKALIGAGAAATTGVSIAQAAGWIGTAIAGKSPTTAGLVSLVSAVAPLAIGLVGGGSGIGALIGLAGKLVGRKS